MQTVSNQIIIAIIVIIVFFVFASVIAFFVVIYLKRQIEFKKQTEQLRTNYQNELIKSQLEMQEQTFHTISQEIHDNVGQLLSLAKVQLNILYETTKENKELLHEAKENIGKAITDLRDIAKSLSNDWLQQITLEEAIQQEVDKLNRGKLFVIQVLFKGEAKGLSNQKKLIAFRVVQESMQNIIKHAKAQVVKINMINHEKNFKICICDDGIGFDVNISNNGLGLKNIINRTSLAGGIASISSILGNGSEIKINIPYE